MTEKLSAFTQSTPTQTDFVAGATLGSPNKKFLTTDLGGFLPASTSMTFYVDPSGSDTTGDGSIGNPFQTNQHGLNYASKFDYQNAFFPTVHTNAGTYNCTGSGLNPAGITLPLLRNCSGGFWQGASSGTVLIQFAQSCCSLNQPGTQWTIRDLGWDWGSHSVPQLWSAGNASRLVVGNIHALQDSSSSGIGIICGAFTAAELTLNATINIASPFAGFAVAGEFGTIDIVGGSINLPVGNFGNLWLDFQDGDIRFLHLIGSGAYTNAASFTGNKTLISGAPSVIQTIDGTTDVFPGTNFGGNGIDGQCQIVNQAAFGGWNLPLFDNQVSLGNNCAKNTMSYAKDTLNGQCYFWINDGGTQLRIKQIGRVPNVQTGATYTIHNFDSDGRIEMSSATANTVTVPVNASVSLAIGTEIKVTQTGAGSTTIAAASGLTAHNFGALSGQWASVVLYKRAADEWVQTTC